MSGRNYLIHGSNGARKISLYFLSVLHIRYGKVTRIVEITGRSGSGSTAEGVETEFDVQGVC